MIIICRKLPALAGGISRPDGHCVTAAALLEAAALSICRASWMLLSLCLCCMLFWIYFYIFFYFCFCLYIHNPGYTMRKPGFMCLYVFKTPFSL